MNILVVNNGSKHILELVQCFRGHEVKVLKYRKHTRLDREWADMFVLSGGSRPALFKKFFYKELKLIRETKKPLIGICLGYELIAEAFGAKLKRRKTRTVGIKEISITPEYFGLESGGAYTVFEAHRWSLAENGIFEIVGSSVAGPEIIKHPSRKIIGFQFHPEVIAPKNDGALLLKRATELLNSD